MEVRYGRPEKAAAVSGVRMEEKYGGKKSVSDRT
jgi:hypothetical protein